MNIQGKIAKVYPIRSGISQATGSEWKSRDVKIEWQESGYGRQLIASVFGESRLQQIDELGEGEAVFAIDFKAREYNGKEFNSVSVYSIRPIAASTPAQAQAGWANADDAAGSIARATDDKYISDDLPF